VNQSQIAERLGTTPSTISRIKLKDGSWDKHKVPNASIDDFVIILKQIILLKMMEIAQGQIEDESRAYLDLRNLVATLWDFQKMKVTVSAQNEMISLQKHMEWLVKNPKLQEKALDAAQVHHDALQKQL
jgi:transcriptional regulator with XRE-family HTH domain